MIRKTRKEVVEIIKAKDTTGQNLTEDLVDYVSNYLEEKRESRLSLVRKVFIIFHYRLEKIFMKSIPKATVRW